MSKESQNLNMNNSKEISPSLHQVSLQDLIRFKEELLKDLRDYKTKISNNINTEFEKYNILLDKSKRNLNLYEKEKSSFMSKIDFVEEKEKLFFEVTNRINEFRNQVMINQVHISAGRKDIDSSCFKYDKIISDNLLVPGLIGKSCKFGDLKEYILFNKEEINNALLANRQAGNDLNLLRKKIDTNTGQINTKLKSLEYRLTNFIISKYNEISHKFEGLYEELNKRMNTLTHELHSNLEERNNELARLKNFVFEENGKAIENVKTIKGEVQTEFNNMKKNFKDIKKNIINLTNLLMGRNFNQNKQLVINSFNNMMVELFREFNLAPKVNPHMSLHNNISPPLIRKNTIKPAATSYIKQYIEGKISSDETKFIHESVSLKRKKSFQLNENNVNKQNNDNNNNQSNNVNIKVNKLINNDKLILTENKNGKKELNKDITKLLHFEPINKSFIKKNTTTFINIPKKIEQNEIINEEDSNKYISSNSKNSHDEKRNNNEKRKSTIKSNKKKQLDILDSNEKINEKKNTESLNVKPDFNLNLQEKKVIEFSESSSSSKKLDNSEVVLNKNDDNDNDNNNIKIENTNILNSNHSSVNQKKNSFKYQNTNDFKIINNYTYYNKKNNKGGEDNNKKNLNNNFEKKLLFNGLKTETAININIKNIENKLQNNNIEKRFNNNEITNLSLNIKNNFTQNIKKENIDKISFLNQNEIVNINRINLKKNHDLKDIKEMINKTDNILYNYNSNKKLQKEGLQLPSNKKNNINPRKDSPIIIKSSQIKDSDKVIDNNKNNIYTSSYSNYASKIPLLPKKDLLLKKTQDNNCIEENEEKKIEEKKTEENAKFSSFDKKNNNINKNSNKEFKVKSAQKQSKKKLDFNKINKFKDDKEIYLSKDILINTRYIKDENIIDKPLLYDTQVFKFEKNKGTLENRIAELEYFTKKKLDELVKEIKIFIPIHFNSHIKNYSGDKKI